MRDLDETDMTILEMLSDDARTAYSDIGAAVDLSAPAVSDRVSRLEESGVIQGFTLDIDRSKLRGGVPLLVEVETTPGHTDTVRERIDDAEAVEHVFETAEGALLFHARVPHRRMRALLDDIAAGDAVDGYEVRLLTDVEWTPTVGGSGFALECAECGNTVSSEGQASQIGGSVYQFCCPTCKSRFEQRHERLEDTT